MPNRLRGGALFVFCVLFSTFAVSAQTSTRASLSNPNIDSFPQITVYLDVHDSQGNFYSNLKSEQVQILENGSPITAIQLQKLLPGVQFVVAINPGPSFGIRNNQAVSRFDQIKETLKSWAKSRLGTNIDDWSLIITNGPSTSHVTKGDDWLATLETEQVNPRTAIPNIDTLFHAVSITADQVKRPGMSRTILFITPPPEENIDQTLESLVPQAKEQGISINIWMVTSNGIFSTQSVKQLMAVAEGTGGKFFTFTGEETLPNPEEYFNPLRSIYSLEYQSNIRNSGVHQLAVRVQMDSEQIETETISFEIDLQPPVPAFVSPPITVYRKPANYGSEVESQQSQVAEAANLRPLRDSSLTLLAPEEETLRVVFDFPDGRKRSLAQTSLTVDGVVVSQNVQPPFDQFSWPLDSYAVDGVHTIQVKAEDILGLVGSSVEIPVQIIVERPNINPWAPVQKNLLTLSVLAVLFAGGLLFLVLVMGRRIRPYSLKAAGIHLKRRPPIAQRISMSVESTSRAIPKWVDRLQLSRQPGAPNPLATLHYVSGSDELSNSHPFSICSEEIIIGTEADQATLVLNDSSIEAIHARIKREADGRFILYDEGSVAGTWVNYSPVPKEGTRLDNGDLVCFGRVGFRFVLCELTQKRRPQVSPGKETEQPFSDNGE
jgi:hypothetical protein